MKFIFALFSIIFIQMRFSVKNILTRFLALVFINVKNCIYGTKDFSIQSGSHLILLNNLKFYPMGRKILRPEPKILGSRRKILPLDT